MNEETDYSVTYKAIANTMSRSAYWRLESGANFELKTLIRICILFKISLAEFFEGVTFP